MGCAASKAEVAAQRTRADRAEAELKNAEEKIKSLETHQQQVGDILDPASGTPTKRTQSRAVPDDDTPALQLDFDDSHPGAARTMAPPHNHEASAIEAKVVEVELSDALVKEAQLERDEATKAGERAEECARVAELSRRDEAEARTAAEAQRDEAIEATTAAEAQRDEAIEATTAVKAQRDEAIEAKTAAEARRDEAIEATTAAEAQRDEALQAKKVAAAERDKAIRAKEAAEAERDEVKKAAEEAVASESDDEGTDVDGDGMRTTWA